MWPFTSKTLYDRYSKLMKLIMSIDSHFEIIENKKDSVRLHLPNYKGNQPMDFHIYLLEPFLYISFVTEVEGEKITVLNNYHESVDQQDMFNMAMSSNLERVHRVLEKTSREEEHAEENQTVETNSSYNSGQEQQENGIPVEFAIEDLKETFDYKESFKKHALTFLILRPKSEFWYYSEQDDEKPLWIYNDKEEKNDLFLMEDRYVTGTFPFLWYLKKYENKEDLCWFFDFLNRHNMDLWTQEYAESTVNPSHPEELIKEMKRYVPSLNIRNNPQNIKVNLGWSWIDIQSMIRFIDYCMNNTDWADKPNDRVKTLQDCSTLCDLAYLVMKDMGYEYNHSNQKEKDNEPTIIESWSLLEFAKENGAMKVTAPMTHVNTKTGEEFLKRKCAFIHPTKKDDQGKPFVIFVDFSPEIGELTPNEISAQQNDLIVVKYESGDYSLKRKEIENNENHTTEVTEKVCKDDFACKVDNIEMIYCKYCGKRIEADSKFCVYCGKQLNQDVFVLKDFPNNIISAIPVNSQEDLDKIISMGNESMLSGDYEKAYLYLREAARYGDAQSAFNTGLLLFKGDGVERNEERAMTFFMQAAENGYIQAYNSIGVCFALGKGVPKDMPKAVSWYQKGADKGDKLAQNSLGRCYLVGDGVEKNLELGIYWTKKSAEQGYNGSLFNMGYCYETGLGVPKDVSKAIHYYKEAFEKGYREAGEHLKKLQND